MICEYCCKKLSFRQERHIGRKGYKKMLVPLGTIYKVENNILPICCAYGTGLISLKVLPKSENVLSSMQEAFVPLGTGCW